MADIEKVKQGLRCCEATSCNDCPYSNETDETYPLFCRHVLDIDALSVIESLQAENKELRGKIASLKDTLRRAKPDWIIE